VSSYFHVPDEEYMEDYMTGPYEANKDKLDEEVDDLQKFTLKSDHVHNPTHYNKHGVECILAIKASMTQEEFEGYLKGNSLKYLWRYKYKDKPVEDLEKAQWYLSRLIEEVTDADAKG